MRLARPSRLRGLSATRMFAVTLAAIVVGTHGSAAQAARATDPAVARAESLFTARNYAGAAAAYERLTRAEPGQPRYWVRYGAALQRAGRAEDAIDAYRRAIALAPAPVAMFNLATVYAVRGEKDSAFHWLDESVKVGFTSEKALIADPDLAALRGDARYAAVVAAMRAARAPCLTRPESRRFDFWVGDWDVTNVQGQAAGSSSVQLLLEGCALYENWTDAQGGAGKSLNSFNTDTRQWQQFWTDQYGRVTEYRESEWVDGSLRFTAHQIMPQGPALVRMTFTPLDSNLVRQWGQMSLDDGKSWTTTFDLHYHRRPR